MAIDDAAYRAILTGRAGPVLIADATGTLLYVNEAAAALLGWEREELAGKPITAIVPPGMRARHQEGFRRYLATGVPRVLGRPIRVPVLCRNGTEPRLELTLSTLDTSDGPLLVATLRELTTPRTDDRPVDEQRALNALRHAASALEGAGTADQWAARGVEALQAHLGATVARVWIADRSGERLSQPPRVRRRLGPPDPLPAEVELSDPASLLASVARSGTPYLQNNLNEEAHWNGDWLRLNRLRSAALVPMRSGSTLAGLLGYFSDQPISAEMAGLLGLFAALLAGELGAVERARLKEELRHEQRRRAALAALTRRVARGERGEKLTTDIVEAARKLSGSDQGLVALQQPGHAGLRVVACAAYPTPICDYVIAPGCGASSAALDQGRTLIVPNYRSFQQALPPLRQRGVQSVIVTPIYQGEDAVGVLKLESKKPGKAYGCAEVTVIEEYADLVALATTGCPS